MKLTKRIQCISLLVLLLIGMTISAACEGQAEIRTGDVICFGVPDDDCGFDGKWLVLDSSQTNTGESGMFVVSLNLIGSEQGGTLLFRDIGDVAVSFSDTGKAFAAEHPGSTAYQGSDIQHWCQDFARTHLSEAEYDAVLPTVKSDDAAVIPGFGIPLPGAMNGTVDFDPVAGILNGDRLFLLSAEEITNAEYGFSDARARVAQYRGSAEGYWLRSPHIDTFPLDVGFVFSFGTVMDFPVNANYMIEMNTYARPACNLDSGRLTDIELLGQEGDTRIWRVSFGEANERSYDTTLPVIGEVMNLQKLVSTAFYVMVGLLLVLLMLAVLLLRRCIRKRRAKRGERA